MPLITETSANGVDVLEINGRLDFGTSDQLQKAVEAALERGSTRLVIDCKGLNYVSSSGLRVFILAGKQFKAGGGKLTISGLSPMVYKVFEISGLPAVLDIVGTREEALGG